MPTPQNSRNQAKNVMAGRIEYREGGRRQVDRKERKNTTIKTFLTWKTYF